MDANPNRIAFVICFYGKWPVWYDAFLLSCSYNPEISWLFVSDLPLPQYAPDNVHLFTISFKDLNQKINAIVGVEVPLSPRKFCDLKPAYSHIFEDLLNGYDFWGICDVDIIWGNIRAFITDEILSNYDIISSRKENISGHFTLFRNSQKNRLLYQNVPGFKEAFSKERMLFFDEQALSQFLKQAISEGSLAQKVYWPGYLVNKETKLDSRQEYHLDRWLWENGKIYMLKNGKKNQELMYLHFINWKNTMKYCEVASASNADPFYISYNGIHFEPHSYLDQLINIIRNFFNGYYRKEELRIFNYKFSRLLRTFMHKLYGNK